MGNLIKNQKQIHPRSKLTRYSLQKNEFKSTKEFVTLIFKYLKTRI
jgi:hypothetical protein